MTIVIPVHNGAATLPKVIGPLLEELEPSDSLIAVDDRSTDGSRDILEDAGIITVPSRGRPGAAGTRNTGGMLAETDWILFIDCDAVPPRGWRTMLKRRFDKVDAVQGIYSKEAAGTNLATFYKNYYYHHTFTRRIKGPYIKGCGTFFFAVRTGVFRELGGFDENISGATIEDADFSERLWARGGRIVIAPEIEVFHLREYKAMELLRYEWRMMTSKALYILRRDPSRGAPSVSVAGFREMLPVLSGAVFSWVFLIGCILFAAGLPHGPVIAAAGLALTGAGQVSFKYHAFRDGGMRGALSCIYLLPDLLMIVPAVIAAAVSFSVGRRY